MQTNGVQEAIIEKALATGFIKRCGSEDNEGLCDDRYCLRTPSFTLQRRGLEDDSWDYFCEEHTWVILRSMINSIPEDIMKGIVE